MREMPPSDVCAASPFGEGASSDGADSAPMPTVGTGTVTPWPNLGRGRMPPRGAEHAVGERAERYSDTSAAQQRQLPLEEWAAGVPLGRGGLVGRRRASDCCGDVRIAQFQAVAGSHRRGLVCEAAAMQGRVQEIARAVAGEHPSGAVRSMSSGCQPNQHHPRCRIAEAGHTAAPVVLVGESGSLVGGGLLAPCHQPVAAPARRDLVVQRAQRRDARYIAGGTRWSAHPASVPGK